MNESPYQIFKKYKIDQLLMPLNRGEEQLFLPNGPDALVKLYKKAEAENRPLRVKLGIDPTSTDLHLGHTVCLFLLRRFQEQGHQPVLIIGDFTATVGDPSGLNEARPVLTHKQAMKNAQTYLNQVRKILDKDLEFYKDRELHKVEIRYNSEWFSKMNMAKLLELAHLVTVNRLIAKEAFGKRIEDKQPLYLHEVLYPLLQGYDSVEVDADIEIGGIDQTFNVLFGRDVQKHYGKPPQHVILNPLLIGLDGKRKMSKTFNNYIALSDPPDEMFGKAMSIPDELIMSYMNLTDTSVKEWGELQESLNKGENPRNVKIKLARKLVEQFHGIKEADIAESNFIKQFQKSEIPDSVKEYILNESLKITDLMYKAGLVPSKAEAKRLIDGGGVKLKSIKIGDPNLIITEKDKNSVLQIGKRKFIRIV